MVNIEQIQKDLDTGVMVGRVTIAALVKYAAHLEQSRKSFINSLADIEPVLQIDSQTSAHYHECPVCNAEAGMVHRNGQWTKGPMQHKPDCAAEVARFVKKAEGINEQK